MGADVRHFMGSGTTLITAEITGRVAFGVELNPVYVDVAIERWRAFTGCDAVLDGDGRSFDEVKASRLKVSTEAAAQATA